MARADSVIFIERLFSLWSSNREGHEFTRATRTRRSRGFSRWGLLFE